MKEELTKALATIEENTESASYHDNIWKVYITACEDYSRRGITHPTGTLPAVSSLMNRFVPHLKKYYAGLWEHNLLVGLQWKAGVYATRTTLLLLSRGRRDPGASYGTSI